MGDFFSAISITKAVPDFSRRSRFFHRRVVMAKAHHAVGLLVRQRVSKKFTFAQ